MDTDDSTEATTTEPVHPTGQNIGGIEILVQMAARGEIDSKNIDIIDIADQFLRAIAAAPKENLRQSGKILFHASVLLRMKAEALLALADEPIGDDYLDFDANGSPIIYDSHNNPIARQITISDLERALVRRASKLTRQRKVTLEQLIEALREAEKMERHRPERVIGSRIDLEGQPEVNDVEDILDLAHDEDIEMVITRVEQLLIEVLETGNLLSLVEIVRTLGGKGDWVDAFLALLFLSNAGKINLEQEKFWGPLYISRGQETPIEPVTAA